MFSFLSKKGASVGAKKPQIWVLLLGAALGIGLLLLGSCEDEAAKSPAAVTYDLQNDELILYQTHLEGRVKELCHSVSGVGNVSAVIVTLEGGFGAEYAVDLSGSSEKYVLIGSGNGESGLLLSRTAPEIAGIGVVCSGGGNASVRQELILLLSSALDVPCNHIYISESAK